MIIFPITMFNILINIALFLSVFLFLYFVVKPLFNFNDTDAVAMKRSKSRNYKGKKHTPLPTGQYTVGCTDLMTPSKCGIFLRLYYPAEQTGDKEHFLEWTPWVPSHHYIDGYARRINTWKSLARLYFSIFIGNSYIPALWNATLSKNADKFPVIVFSHGLSGWRTVSSAICMDLASHGFIVAALEHRDQSASASLYMKPARMSIYGEFPGSSLEDLDQLLEKNSESEFKSALVDEWDPKQLAQSIGPTSYKKEWIYYLKVGKEDEAYVRKNQLIQRAHECVQAFDVLESLNNGNLINILEPNCMESQFFGRLDLSCAAVAGHSFGGSTTMLTLGMESRYKIGIALDPWMFPFYEDHSAFTFIQQPLLTLTSAAFQSSRALATMKLLLQGDSERIFLSIKNSEHRDYSDIPFIKRSLIPCIGVSTEKFIILDITVQLMLEFLEKHLGLNVTSTTEAERSLYKSKCTAIF